MNNEDFKNKVRTLLTEFGILADGDASIFSTDKVIQNETGDSLMLVGPNNSVWVWLGAMMPEKDFNDGITQFKTTVTNSIQEILKAKIQVNPEISIQAFLEGLEKMFGGKVTTTDVKETALKELVKQAMTPSN